MMSELDSVFLLLVLIYGTECTAWMQPQTIAFFRACGTRWRTTRPLCLFGPGQGGLVFGNPLPPLGTVFITYPWPIALSPYAVARHDPDATTDTDTFAYEALQRIDAVSKEIHLNGKQFAAANSASGARFFAELIRHISTTPVDERQRSIAQAMAHTLDVADLRARLAAFQQHAWPLRLTGNALFLFMFVALPLSSWLQMLHDTWPWLGAASLLLLLRTAMTFSQAHKTLYPQAKADRLSHLTTMLVSPPLAIRAHDLLARPLFETAHPLAVASVLCPSHIFHAMARQTLYDLRQAGAATDTATSAPDRPTAWFNTKLCEAVEEMLQRIGVPPDTLFTPPPPQDPSCQAYCPRCGCQYTIPSGICADCDNLPLVALPQVASPEDAFGHGSGRKPPVGSGS